ncbi:MAG: hypothetical protein DRP90_06335 [Planctomycetota bacterium]|nr:MAG: hypothetical protein DRP90_06335 [Planctomycetota bacterium]
MAKGNERPRAAVFAYHEMGVVGLERLEANGYEVRLLVTHRPPEGEEVWYRLPEEWAARRGIRTAYGEDLTDGELEALVREAGADFIFSFHYRKLLGGRVLAAARRGAYNLHPSLLPAYRGRAPINWVLVNGERETGVTLHVMVERADAGPIAGQRRVAIEFRDTALTLYRKLAAEAAVLLDETLPRIADGTVELREQDPASGSYYGRRTPEDGRFEWDMPAGRIYNLVRAVTKPWPGAFCVLPDGRRLVVWTAVPAGPVGGPPGSWKRDSSGFVRVMCSDVSLRLHEVELDGETASGRRIAAFFTEKGIERLA